MRKSGWSLLGVLTLCSLLMVLETGCITSLFDTSSAQASNGGERTIPPRPTKPQDASLIVPGKYEGRGWDDKPCHASITRNSSAEYPFTLNVPSVKEECYQRENTLICPDEYGQDIAAYVLVEQLSPTEIEITDLSVGILYSGTGVGDAELCEGRLKKISK